MAMDQRRGEVANLRSAAGMTNEHVQLFQVREAALYYNMAEGLVQVYLHRVHADSF